MFIGRPVDTAHKNCFCLHYVPLMFCNVMDLRFIPLLSLACLTYVHDSQLFTSFFY